jgi:hypothetical protein
MYYKEILEVGKCFCEIFDTSPTNAREKCTFNNNN